MVFSFFGTSCSSNSPSDFDFIDDYLVKWDRFAQGDNQLAPYIKQNRDEFQTKLATALSKGDKRAPSRLVFYGVVQVGGFIPYESELGRGCEKVVGKEVPIFTSEKGERTYFAGHLYFWWERHKTEYETFSLYQEWQKREFARMTVIPMYESATKKK